MDDIGEGGGVACTGTRAIVFELLPVVIEDWSGVLLLLEVMEKNARPIYVWRMFGWVVESGAFSFLDLLVLCRVRLR